MPVIDLTGTAKMEKGAVENQKVHKTGKYEYIDTKYEGIKEVVSS